MQRYLMRRIGREVEFMVKERDGETTVGFITGMDSRCLQMTTSPKNEGDEPYSCLIYWPVAKISETGRHITDYGHDTQSKVRRWSFALRSHCQKISLELRRQEQSEIDLDAKSNDD